MKSRSREDSEEDHKRQLKSMKNSNKLKPPNNTISWYTKYSKRRTPKNFRKKDSLQLRVLRDRIKRKQASILVEDYPQLENKDLIWAISLNINSLNIGKQLEIEVMAMRMSADFILIQEVKNKLPRRDGWIIGSNHDQWQRGMAIWFNKWLWRPEEHRTMKNQVQVANFVGRTKVKDINCYLPPNWEEEDELLIKVIEDA
jgi:hypothetical protein